MILRKTNVFARFVVRLAVGVPMRHEHLQPRLCAGISQTPAFYFAGPPRRLARRNQIRNVANEQSSATLESPTLSWTCAYVKCTVHLVCLNLAWAGILVLYAGPNAFFTTLLPWPTS